MDTLNYSMKLEAAFNSFSLEEKFTADAFRSRPTEAIEDGLNWIMGSGIISKTDFLIMCQNFDFGNLSLRDIISDELNKEKLDDLLNQLENLKKKGD